MTTDQQPSTLSIEASFRDWYNRHAGADLEALVLDVDGVLLRGYDPLPGAAEFIDTLHRDRFPFSVLTNDGCHSPEEKSGFLRDCGIRVEPEDIISCAHGLQEIVEQNGWRDQLFFVMGSLGTPCYAERAGLAVTRDKNDLPSCTGVIIGERRYDWHEVITAVFNYLMHHPEFPVIVPNPDELFPSKPGRFGIASGAIASFLEHLCSVRGRCLHPVYLGKPYAPIFAFNHHRFEKRLGRELRKDRVLMVGDSLRADIQGGRDFGYATALMLTGMTTRKALEESLIQPDMILRGM